MERKELNLLTYNLDSESICKEERLNVFFDQVQQVQSDIVAIQEGSRDVYSKLFLTMKKLGYKYHHFPEINQKKLGEVIFSKLPILQTEYQRFQHTQQDRGLTMYTIEFLGHKILIATTQLECGSRRAPFLRKQIEQIDKTLSSFNELVIVLGDFQISTFHGNIKEPEGWIDAWEEAGSSKEEYSMDSEINTLAKVRDRPDRVWFLPRSLTCEECNLIGLPVPRKENTFASKHFGVKVRFLVE